MISDGVRTFEWDAQNRLIRSVRGSESVQVLYDGSSRRAMVTERTSGVIVRQSRTVWCGGNVCEERSADGAETTARVLAQGTHRGATVEFQLGDHLSSLRDVSDGSGNRLARIDYDPFGRRVVNGTDSSSAAFASLHSEQRTGLSLAQLRPYDPELGRWLSEDPAGAVHPLLTALENGKFKSSKECRDECDRTRARVAAKFAETLRATQQAENKKCK